MASKKDCCVGGRAGRGEGNVCKGDQERGTREGDKRAGQEGQKGLESTWPKWQDYIGRYQKLGEGKPMPWGSLGWGMV